MAARIAAHLERFVPSICPCSTGTKPVHSLQHGCAQWPKASDRAPVMASATLRRASACSCPAAAAFRTLAGTGLTASPASTPPPPELTGGASVPDGAAPWEGLTPPTAGRCSS